jgi:hypothetical protein
MKVLGKWSRVRQRLSTPNDTRFIRSAKHSGAVSGASAGQARLRPKFLP